MKEPTPKQLQDELTKLQKMFNLLLRRTAEVERQLRIAKADLRNVNNDLSQIRRHI